MSNFTNYLNTDRSEYFKFESSDYDSERSVLANSFTDAFNQLGVSFTYYIRTYDVTYNKILGEDNNSRYTRSFEFMGIYQPPDGNDFFNLFGIDHNNDEILYTTKLHFKYASQDSQGLEYIPKLGDIVESYATKFLYEIVNVPKITDFTYYRTPNLVWEFGLKPYNQKFITEDNIKDTTLSTVNNKPDIFTIKNIVESKKDEILYSPKPNEQPNNNPFVNW